MAQLTDIYDLKNARVWLQDATPVTPIRHEIFFDEGAISFNANRNVEYKMSRGKLDENTAVRLGDDIPLELTWVGRFGAMKSHNSTDLTTYEFLNNSHSDVELVSVGNECEPFAVDVMIEWEHLEGCDPGFDPELIVFPEFRYDTRTGDFKAGSLNVAGKCKTTEPVYTRPAVP